jgi:hypothetical protein
MRIVVMGLLVSAAATRRALTSASRGQLRCLHWQGVRLLHGLDAWLLRYKYPRVTAWIQRHYPPGYVQECPPWAMR